MCCAASSSILAGLFWLLGIVLVGNIGETDVKLTLRLKVLRAVGCFTFITINHKSVIL